MIGAGTDNAWLQPYFLTVFQDLRLLPRLPGHQQHRVADGLAGQAGAGGPEGDRNVSPAGLLENFGYLGLAVCPDDNFGDQAIKTGIGAVGQGPQGIRSQAGFGNE